MTMKTFFRKGFSVLLCVAVFCGCMVFSLPQASAAPVSGGKYYVKVTWDCYNNNKNEGNILIVSYLGQNGQSASYTMNNMALNANDRDKFQTQVLALDGIPTSIEYHNYGSSMNTCQWWVMQIDLCTDATGSVISQTIWKGQFGCSKTHFWGGTAICTLDLTTLEFSEWTDEGTGLKTETDNESSIKVTTPAVSSITDVSGGVSSVAIPTDGSTATSAAFHPGTAYDQYGIEWYQTPSLSLLGGVTGCSLNNSRQLTVDARANRQYDYNVTVRESCGGKNNDKKTVNIGTFDYLVTFFNEDGITVLMQPQSVDYGKSAVAPSVTPEKAYDDTNHYSFASWVGDYTEIEALQQSIAITASYTAEVHAYTVRDTLYLKEAASCFSGGVYYLHCACGKVSADTWTDESSQLQHNYGETILPNNANLAQAATCTQNAVYYKVCLNGTPHWNEETFEAPGTALNHDWSREDAVKTKQCTAANCENAASYYYTCSRCEEAENNAAHTFTSGAALGHQYTLKRESSYTLCRAATCTEPASYYYTCSRCRAVEENAEHTYAAGEALGHDWKIKSTLQSPSCTSAGQAKERCSRCGLEQTNPLPATGHSFITLKQVAPKNGRAGYFYYQCSNGCGTCALGTLDAEGNRQPGEACTEAEAKANSVQLPAPSFNSFYRENSRYDYSVRGASLRIDRDASPYRQALRFAASLQMPQGATVEDFGFIYIRSDYLTNQKYFVIGGEDRLVQFSVKDGHYSTFQTENGQVITFNLVIQTMIDSWEYDFVVRPYIIYKAAGETFTVYDDVYCMRSVDSIAEQAVASGRESQSTMDYLNAKIINRVREIV